jgi:hypothetical protein
VKIEQKLVLGGTSSFREVAGLQELQNETAVSALWLLPALPLN